MMPPRMPPSFPLLQPDARGAAVRLAAPPRRIVSLVPSQTELLAALGLDDEVVGLTRFCVHPTGWKTNKTIVGGTKQLTEGRLDALAPDLVLANKEENTPEMVAAAESLAPVYVTDVPDLPAALTMIRTVGRLVDRTENAEKLTDEIQAGFDALPVFAPLRAAYFIWQRPFMTAGRGTFIDAMLRAGGFVNVFGDQPRYPEVTEADLRTARPDVVLLSSEPYPFGEAQVASFEALLPGALVRLVDGEPFSWYGSRLLTTPDYLRRLREALAAG